MMTSLSKLFAVSALTLSSLCCAEETFDATIPVLDMNAYFDPETKEAFIADLRSALQEVGFFAVVNTGVDPDVLDGAYASAERFFGFPYAQKMQMFDLSLNGQRGYVPGESAKEQKVGDFKEFYHVGRELTAEQQARLGFWKNMWPQQMDLKTPLTALFSALETYMRPLEEAMAEAIGADPRFFTQMTEDGDVLLRAIHYPANPPANLMWAAAHTDIDLFTILPRATADGLQVLNKDGEWTDVKVPEKAFIINAGDMLENVSNGECRSGLHRVISKKEGVERYSMVLFVHPRREDRLDPLPQCIARTGGVRKYAQATRLELLEERLVDLGLASPEMMRHLAESGLMERLLEVGRASPKAMRKLADAGLASPAVLAALQGEAPSPEQP